MTIQIAGGKAYAVRRCLSKPPPVHRSKFIPSHRKIQTPLVSGYTGSAGIICPVKIIMEIIQCHARGYQSRQKEDLYY